MTREELEKQFEEKFLTKNWNFKKDLNPFEVRNFIFETIIPEVLKSITPYEKETGKPAGVFGRYLKGKVKKLYGIDL